MSEPESEMIRILWIDGALETAHALAAGAKQTRDIISLTALAPGDLKKVTDWDRFLDPFEAVAIVASCARGFEPETRRLVDESRARNLTVAVYTADPELRADLTASGTLAADAAESFYRLLARGDAESTAEALGVVRAAALGRELSPARPVERPSVMEYRPEGLPVHEGGPCVAVVFSRRLWIDANMAGIDAMMAALAERGLTPVGLHVEAKDMAGFRLLDDLINRLEVHGPAAVLSYTAFSMRNMARGAAEVISRLEKLGAPWFVSPILQCRAEAWEKNPLGLSIKAQTMYVTLPEFDGRIAVPPTMARSEPSRDPATGIELAWMEPVPDRVAWTADLIRAYVDLNLTPNHEKRIALVLHNYPPNNSGLASAVGLDGPASAAALLEALKARGYEVGDYPKDGQSLADRLTRGCSLDEEWLTPEKIQSAPGFVDPDRLEAWQCEWPESAAEAVRREWGRPPGEALCSEKGMPVPGFRAGNVLVALQPPRGKTESLAEDIHSKCLPPNHAYLAFYHFIREEFRAQAVIHLGKHGSLEWLPGKAAGLCRNCFPELVLGPTPHFYPYIVNSFSEGAAVKRRTHGVIIGHMPPPLARAGARPEWASLGRAIDAARQTAIEMPEKAEPLIRDAVDMALEQNFHSDLGWSEEEARQKPLEFAEAVHDRFERLQSTVISDGLHVLGRPPEGARMARFLEILAQSDNSGAAALGPAMAEMLGIDPLSPSSAGRISEGSVKVIEEALAGKWTGRRKVDEALKVVVERLYPKAAACTDELTNLLNGLEGRYVPAGPAGAPTRGDSDALPTGRNFYGIDPRLMPTRTAWKSGAALGRSLLEKYTSTGQNLPETVALVGFAGNQIRTGGDDLAQALWLMGLEPIWSEPSGFVRDVVPVPLEELGRPRIDVVMRISGMFRDSLAEAIELIDMAVSKVAALDEPLERNFIRKHLRGDVARAIRSGLSDEEALRRAAFRVFSGAPGAYGAGVSGRLNRGAWSSREDLGRDFIERGMYAYNGDGQAVEAREAFVARLEEVGAVVKNWDHLEHDLLDSDDFYSYFGGLAAAAESVRRAPVDLFIGRDADPGSTETVWFREEQTRVIRTRATNPRWLEGLRRHGYAGGAKMADAVANAFGLAAAADRFEDWMYEELAESILFEEENRAFLETNNPLALQTAAGVLLDAVQRGMWHTDEETLAKLEAAYLRSETILEGDE